MAFIQQEPRLFTQKNVEALNPDQSGVYGIFKQGQWIYIGKGDLRKRLLSHLNGDNPCILAAGPTHWVGEVLRDPAMSAREVRLTIDCKPICNQRVG